MILSFGVLLLGFFFFNARVVISLGCVKKCVHFAALIRCMYVAVESCVIYISELC